MMEERIIHTYELSLDRCAANPAFFERFYQIFIASSPKVAAKFAQTDFERQMKALEASLHLMIKAVRDDRSGMDAYLKDLADRHSCRDLNIGSEFYDYWLDSLLATVKEFDPAYDESVRDAWERVMLVGIEYMLSRYA
jgi:hemoglobin-like flavoprotein